mmetsp:Transcript_49074/g.140832  ORF Transcript_49074/g.140832 Transcript_49074/m.140832 type:complete len:206 (+) Transcript_49074:550-1167(+)
MVTIQMQQHRVEAYYGQLAVGDLPHRGQQLDGVLPLRALGAGADHRVVTLERGPRLAPSVRERSQQSNRMSPLRSALARAYRRIEGDGVRFKAELLHARKHFQSALPIALLFASADHCGKCHHARGQAFAQHHIPEREREAQLARLATSADRSIVNDRVRNDKPILHLEHEQQRSLPLLGLLASRYGGTVTLDVRRKSPHCQRRQ